MRWLRKKFWLNLAWAFSYAKDGAQAAEEFCNSKYSVAIGMGPDDWMYI